MQFVLPIPMTHMFSFKCIQIQVLVAHACNPSYSGGRDQEDHSSKTAWANSEQDPISKTPSQERAGGVAQSIGPEFKPQYQKKKKKVFKWVPVAHTNYQDKISQVGRGSKQFLLAELGLNLISD
jgi:hypothetical protein